MMNKLYLSGVEDNQPLGSLLVHDSITTFTASDCVPGFDLVLLMTF